MGKRRYMIRYRDPVLSDIPYSSFYNRIGTNTGNLVYTAGIMRALMVDRETEFVSPPHGFVCSAKETDRINETCSAFILNLADAIRRSNIDELERITAFVKKLRIPCIIIGCGLSAPYEPGEDFHYDFDDVIRKFIAAVLEKSSIVGIRGEITGEYLKRIGFREEKDYTVIGCPSMYIYGEELPYRDTWSRLSENDAKLSINVSQKVNDHVMEILTEAAAKYPNASYLPQNSDDCILAYYGIQTDNARKLETPNWPSDLDHPFFREHEVCIFNHPLAWINYQRGRDFSIGTRVHGNITAVLAGTPALFLPQVARTRELCEYHKFAYLPPRKQKKMDSIYEAAAKKDFQTPVRRQKETFPHYLDFLKQNALPNIFEEHIGNAAFDEVTADFAKLPSMVPISKVSAEEAARRKREWGRANLISGVRKYVEKIIY